MQFRRSAFALVFFFLSFTPFALASGLAYEDFVGKWKMEKLQPSGEIVVARLEITPDHKFSGTVTSNGTLVWRYAGTFELNGNHLTWTYLHSSKPLPPNFQDTDLILSVKEDSFSYSSTSSSETGIYDRVK